MTTAQRGRVAIYRMVTLAVALAGARVAGAEPAALTLRRGHAGSLRTG